MYCYQPNQTDVRCAKLILLPCLQKNIRFDFDDELKIGDVRYKHLTQITIKVQLF